MAIEPLRVSEVHSSLPQWTCVIQVIEASHLKTSYAEHASKKYRRFVFADSQGVKVSVVAFDGNVAHIEGLFFPFKRYCISNAAVEEIPRPAPPGLQHQASVSGELAEQLLGFTAVAATDSYNKNEELPLDMIHDTLKSKTTFIAQVRPGNTKDTNLRTPKTMNSLKNSP